MIKQETLVSRRRALTLAVGCGLQTVPAIATDNKYRNGFALKSVGDEEYFEAVNGSPRTLLVQLHSWSGTKEECLHESTAPLGSIRDCVWVCPHFGGPNNHPEGANHPAQMARIKRVIDASIATYATSRVVLCGVSGGAGTALYMLGYFPGMFAAATLWCGYHDLQAWYEQSRSDSYPKMMDACFGGPPKGREALYLARSPKGVLSKARQSIVFINHGSADTDILPEHSRAAASQLSGRPGVEVRSNIDDGNHRIDYPTAAAQLSAVLSF